MDKFPVILSLDLETTGFDDEKDSIIEIGLFKFTLDKNGAVKELDSYSQLIDPQREIPEEVQAITNIKPEDVAGQPEFSEIKKIVSEKFTGADYVLGHNPGFDLSFLKKVWTGALPPAIDSQFFAEVFFPGLPSYSLDVLPFELKVEKGQAHRALPDAKASAEVFAAALRQFSALKKSQSEILDLSEAGQLLEKNIFQLSQNFTTNEPWRAEEFTETKPKIIPDIKKAVADALGRGERIIIHTAVRGASFSVAAAMSQPRAQKIIFAAKNKHELAHLDWAKLFDISKLVCLTRLRGQAQKALLRRPEAVLAMKLLVARQLDSSPRTSEEERFYLPALIVRPDICSKHDCPNKEIFEALKQKSFAVATTHYDFWGLENLPADTQIVISDFDEAVDVLMKKSESKLTQDFLPKLVDALPVVENEEIEKLRQSVINKNDLFWGVLNINCKNLLEENMQVHLTSDLRDEYEFEKILASAGTLIESMTLLITRLKENKDDYVLSHSAQLEKVLADWQKLFQDNGDHHLYLESYNGRVDIRIYPSFTFIEKKFKASLPENTVLTAATGSEAVSAHYLNILNINEWPQTKVRLLPEKQFAFHIIKSASNPVDTTLKILLTNASDKSLVVAKNSRELFLFREHLQNGLGEDYKIFSLDGGGRGAGKAIHGFSREDKAVLLVPPRGRILEIPWPLINLAIVNSIPFPIPEAHVSFMSSGFPKAMLAQKLLISKILKSGSADLKLFLLDNRLTSQRYGQNFIELTQELCGCPPEYHTL